MSDTKHFFTVADAAAELHCSENTIRAKARQGALPGVKFGDDWVFPVKGFVEAVNELARSCSYYAKQARGPSGEGGAPSGVLMPASAVAKNSRPKARPEIYAINLSSVLAREIA